MPSYVWAHVLFMYLYSWSTSMIALRSSVIHPGIPILDNIAAIDFIFTSILFVLGLMMIPTNKPIYIESFHGFEPNMQPLANIASIISFSWVTPIIWKGYFKILTMDDVWDLKDEDRSSRILKSFRKYKENATFLVGLLRFFKWQLIGAIFWSVFHSMFAFVPSVVIRVILEYIESPETTPKNVAWLYIFFLLVSTFLNALGNGQALWNGRVICIRIRAIIIGELYAKALRRKAAAGVNKVNEDNEIESEEQDIGGIINLMAVDAFKVGEVCAYMHFIVGGITMITLSLILLYRLLGTSAIAGAFTMICILPIHWYFSRIFGICQAELMKTTDKRVHKTNEVLNSIKIIKFFAWEARFFENVNESRADELRMLRKRFVIWAVSAVVWYGAPILISFVTFGFYTIIFGETLSTPVAFSALALFNLMRIPLDQLAEIFTNILQSKTSIDRIQEFLNESETDKYEQLSNARRSPTSPSIGFENATFTWGPSEGHEFRIENVSIDFKVGALNLIVGPTGAGKTSLLMALLGEMKLVKGNVFLPGVGAFGQRAEIDRETGLSESIAYCAQNAWLLNDTVKNNILFGNDYDADRYKSCIEACGLKRDFEILEGGDQTEVGERGIALSGGQKQRISLARALYSPARHLLLDDCLSAVDSHTASWIYENCIMGPMMFGRTCILVSHNVALTLSGASHVVYLEHGKVIKQGTAEEIVDAGLLGDDELIRSSASKAASRSISRSTSVANLKKQVDIAKAVQEVEVASNVNNVSNSVNVSSSADGTDKKSKHKLVMEESSQTGTVAWKIYMVYFNALGDLKYWIVVLILFLIFQYLLVFQSWWIRQWAADVGREESEVIGYVSSFSRSTYSSVSSVGMAALNTVNNAKDKIIETRSEVIALASGHSSVYYLAIYGVTSLAYFVMVVVREGAVFWGSLRASKKLFERLLLRVMYSKLRFFDATPVGRIMNRFSKDMEITDQEIAPVFVTLCHSILTIVIIVIIITFIMPKFLMAAALIIFLFYLIVIFFLSSSRELKRMDAVTRSPIYQHFGETINGVTTIRAYGYEDTFLKENELRIDNNNRPFWSVWACNRWMSFRVDVVGSSVSFFTGIFVLLSVGKLDSGLAGLSLSYAIMFTDALLWFIWVYAQNEMNMNSIERIDEYLYIDQEADQIVPENRPPPGWPKKGAISVDNLSLRYAPGLPKVIKDVSFNVKPTHKIGIVGRTGAGKSTIASAFFRFLEAETGKIVIDGIDISKIGLYDLRSSITIIPQDPTLFTGTVRSNLDPFGNYSDEEVYRSLLRVHLIDSIPKPSDTDLSVTERHKRRVIPFYNLESQVTEGGGNLSQGQRQLMCLARSLLRSPKVILLDEATASIDYNTDAQIQETIREEFADTTIITIAHRLRSIIDYDMILVLDAGMIKEYDKPHNLLQMKDSIFRSMCENSGELEQLEELAAKAFTDQSIRDSA
ncbi:P-loop containing nucleoside triphosphate hydrolase protein [Dipodascopsis uninucleata]